MAPIKAYLLIIFLISSNITKTLALTLSTSSHSLFINRHSISRLKTSFLSLSTVQQDIGVSVFASGASYAWLQLWIILAKEGIIQPSLSRKIIHSGSAPLFMALWILFSNDPHSKLYAASVPALQVGRLLLAGISRRVQSSSQTDSTQEEEDGIVKAISRSGNKKEALQGPLIYTIVLFLATALFFRDSSIGVVAVCQMAVGDGLADIFGRRWGTQKWFFSEKKSYVGTLAFIVGAFLSSYAFLTYFTATGFMSFNVLDPHLIAVVFAITLLCAAVELIPLGDDNVTVPLVAALSAWKFIDPLMK